MFKAKYAREYLVKILSIAMGWSWSLKQACRTACTACLAKDWRKLLSLPPMSGPAGTHVQQQPKTTMWIEPGTKGNTKHWRKTSGYTKEPQHSKRQWVNYSDFSKGHSSCGVTDRLLTRDKKLSCSKCSPGVPCSQLPNIAAINWTVVFPKILLLSLIPFCLKEGVKDGKNPDLEHQFSSNFTSEKLPYVSERLVKART